VARRACLPCGQAGPGRDAGHGAGGSARRGSLPPARSWGTRGPRSGTSLRAVPGARGGGWARRASYTHLVRADPFTVLGLPARPEVGDDEVRAAWRRIAAATHPDRADGGDPARFAAAAAAYTTLRTRSGRGEALADLAAHRPRAGVPPRVAPGLRGPLLGLARLPARVRHGRPARLALRLAVAAAAGAAAVAVAGWTPATPALITGVLTWLLLTARDDLAPPP
jgi:hypothetical protein